MCAGRSRSRAPSCADCYSSADAGGILSAVKSDGGGHDILSSSLPTAATTNDTGLSVRYSDGTQEWVPFSQLTAALGQAEVSRLYKIAYHGGMTGMWYNASNGGNVYANGQEVNA